MLPDCLQRGRVQGGKDGLHCPQHLLHLQQSSVLQREGSYELRKRPNISARNANIMASRALVTFTHKRLECNFSVQRGKESKHHKKLLKAARGFSLNQTLTSGNKPEKLSESLLKLNTLLQLCAFTLATTHVSAYRAVSEISSSIPVVSSGVHNLVGYWVGPDFDDGWGYIEAVVVRLHY